MKAFKLCNSCIGKGKMVNERSPENGGTRIRCKHIATKWHTHFEDAVDEWNKLCDEEKGKRNG